MGIANPEVPAKLDEAVVLKTARVRPGMDTGNTRHTVAGQVTKPASYVAIARYEDQAGCYLLHCDHDWSVLTDTWHESVADAEAQAEFEYAGIRGTWIDSNAV